MSSDRAASVQDIRVKKQARQAIAQERTHTPCPPSGVYAKPVVQCKSAAHSRPSITIAACSGDVDGSCMPHGLTPLGRQLRSVIAALGPSRHDARSVRPLTSSWTRPTDGLGHTRPGQNGAIASVRQYTGGALAQQEEREGIDESRPVREVRSTTLIDLSVRPVTRKQLGRRRVDYLGEELKHTGRSDVAPLHFSGKKDISHYNPRSRHGVRLWTANQRRHAKDYIPDAQHSQAKSLTRVLALYIRDTAGDIEGLRREWTGDSQLSRWDHEILRSRGFDIDDLKVWADIVTEPDPYKAVTTLVARAASHGVQAVPLPIFSYLLRRPCLSPKALRLVIEHAWVLFEDLESNGRGITSPVEVFVVFLRLARSARQVWPQALPSSTEFLTRFMPGVVRSGPVSSLRAIQHMTFLLNRAMSLVAHPTAELPFKDNPHQEAAIVNILAYMANHDPPLQIDRSGYRAVIRIQLAQKKTSGDRLWAELKALSWPPWKEDRTRMDSEVDLEYGVSKAGDTLRRMAEAGYAPEPWEQVAKIYAGWDTDQTPTIQTRAILLDRISARQSGTAIWAARIGSTRTLQEAWACYLAAEDAKHSFDHDVLLAIFEKIAQHERRLKRLSRTGHDEVSSAFEKLLPGDKREIEPLPPSTHLYTYTRRQPPSLHEFFKQLDTNGVQLLGRILAFRIAHAQSFDVGLKHLVNARTRYPGIEALLKPGITMDSVQAPSSIVEAYIALLVKKHIFVDTRARHTSNLQPLRTGDRHLSGQILHVRHSLVHAVCLLQDLKPRGRVPWNSVLEALGGITHKTNLLLITSGPREQREAVQTLSRELNVLVAYSLSCQVLDLLATTYMDLDRDGFMALCHSTENVAIASWRALNADYSTDNPPLAVAEAQAIFEHQEPQRRLQDLFGVLVGSATASPHSRAFTIPDLPRLLTNPGPAILHAYIRALGWCGAYDELRDLVRWMVEHREELAEARQKDRMGRPMTRRMIVALRVFLERSWFDEVDEERQDHEILSRLRAKAPESVVQDIREMVEGVEEWDGWPVDEQVEKYIQNQRFEAVRRELD